MVTTRGGRYVDEVGEAYKMGQQLATSKWIGQSRFRPAYAKLDRGTATVALDLVLDGKLDAALTLLDFSAPDFEIDPHNAAVNAGYRRGFVNQLKDYLSHEGRIP